MLQLSLIHILIVFIVVRAVAGGSKSSDSGYTFFEAEYRDISVVVNATSTVEPLDSYSVIALVRGDVLEAPFEEGDTIEEGDLLYKIDTSDAESTVRQMEENVETARIGVEQAEIALAGAKRSYQDALKALSLIHIFRRAQYISQALYGFLLFYLYISDCSRRRDMEFRGEGYLIFQAFWEAVHRKMDFPLQRKYCFLNL